MAKTKERLPNVKINLIILLAMIILAVAGLIWADRYNSSPSKTSNTTKSSKSIK